MAQHKLKTSLLALLFLTACSEVNTEHKSDVEGFNPGKVKTEVVEMLNNYNKAVEDKGMIGELPFLDSSDQFFWVPPGYGGPISYDSVASFAAQITPTFSWVKLNWEKLEVYPKTNDLAVYTGTLNFMAEDTAGNPITSTLLETGILVKTDGNWKLQSGQTALKPRSSSKK